MARSSPSDPFFEKGLPSNLEAERSILGAILLDNSVCNQAMELMRRDDFFLDSHRRLFDKMILLSERGSSIDLVTLSEELRRANEFAGRALPTTALSPRVRAPSNYSAALMRSSMCFGT